MCSYQGLRVADRNKLNHMHGTTNQNLVHLQPLAAQMFRQVRYHDNHGYHGYHDNYGYQATMTTMVTMTAILVTMTTMVTVTIMVTMWLP